MRKKNYKYLFDYKYLSQWAIIQKQCHKNDAIQYLLKKKQTRNWTIIDTYIYVYLKSVSLVAYFRGK
jgi:hypothetical protein